MGRPPAFPDPRDFLRATGGLSAADLDRLERGEPVARVLDTDRREVAVVGAIHIRASADRVLALYRDVSRLDDSSIVLQVGTFGAPPRAADLQPLVMEGYDLETIRGCTPGDCGVRLSAGDMARFGREVRWGEPDWRTQAGASWRAMLAEFAAMYLSQGDAALKQYRNKEEPLDVGEEMAILFGQTPFFKAAAPAVMQFAEAFPRGRPPGTEDVLYWTKEDFGIRPVFSMTHLILHAAPAPHDPSRPVAMVVAKQIYATHYFDAGLNVTALYAHPAGGVMVVSQGRARTRSLMGFMRAYARSTVRSRSRDALERVLRSMKVTLEQPVPATSGRGA